jgi:hypothetical protein
VRRFVLAALLFAGNVDAQGGAWDAGPWLGDLVAMRSAFAAKYANLDWLREEREVDLDRRFEAVEQALAEAGDDAEARRVLDRFVARIGDGHVALTWPTPGDSSSGPVFPKTFATAVELCAGLVYRGGWKPGTAAALPGFVKLADPGAFAAGTVRVGTETVGVVRIPAFMPEAFPGACAVAVTAVPGILGKPCREQCADTVLTETYRALTREVEASYARLRAAGATVLLVDVTDNGGGTEWAVAIARTLSAKPLRSTRAGFMRGAHWTRHWGDLATRLRGFATKERGTDRRRLLGWAAEAEAARREADKVPGPAVTRVARAGYATGLVGEAPAGSFGDKEWAVHVFSPAQYPYRDGAWDGPVVVLVNGETWSAAEQFAAELRDNDAAIVIGGRTGGAGCGHTNGGTPTTLPHSRAVLSLPDCVRYRADGSNEVRGIVPERRPSRSPKPIGSCSRRASR